MELEMGPHLEEAELEQYSMGTLPEQRITAFEEHFLVCEVCQDQLLEMEAYVNAVRSVSPKLRKITRSPFQLLRWHALPQTALAAAAIIMAIVVIRVATPAHPVKAEMAAVFLQANRGIEGLTIVKAGQPLSLRMDLRELPPAASYRVEVVDASGGAIHDVQAIPRDGAITQELKSGVSAGAYYVRLYGVTKQLLREYRLEAR